MNIANIINFIRGVEPRDPELDIVEPVVEQIKLIKKHNLPGTWLLQYDALIDNRFVDLMKGLDDKQEIGVWFEVMQPLVEAAGLQWRGRPGYSWDWHTDCGFSVGYTQAEREKLADVFMAEFKRVFGRYPRSMGSWLFDAHLLEYLGTKYGLVSSCNCKDQWGTDGYTMWGGYYNQAYYPSKENSFIPAQNASEQIPVPVFRMLGSDPIYQYDVGLGGETQGVITLEPVYAGETGGGGDPKWVDWFFKTIYGTPNLTFGYTQIGQENSFGWKKMGEGLTYQIEQIAKKAAAGEVTIQTLGDSGEWFRSNYDVTPASAVTALEDWRGKGRKSVWYCSRFYRVNLFWDQLGFRIRDMHIFDENYPEPHLTEVCTEHACTYDTYPVIDGMLWSDDTQRAGVWFEGAECSEPKVTEDRESLTISGGNVKIVCEPQSVMIDLPEAAKLKMQWAKSKQTPIKSIAEKSLRYEYKGQTYSVSAKAGTLAKVDDGVEIRPEAGRIVLSIC